MATAHKMEHFPQPPDPEPEEKIEGEFFFDPEGKKYEVRPLPDPEHGLIVEVKREGGLNGRLLPREWERFRDEHDLKHLDEALNEREEIPDITTVKVGDILEMSDGSYLKILVNDPDMGEVTFEHIEPDQDTHKRGEKKSRGYDLWRTYQDEVKEYLPAKISAEKTEVKVESPPKPARRPDAPMSKDNTPEYEWATGKGREKIPINDTKPVKMRENPLITAQKKREADDQKRYDEIMADLAKSAESEPDAKKGRETPPAAKEALEKAAAAMKDSEAEPAKKVQTPLGLKEGQTIWTERGEGIKVVKVENNFVILGFEPLPGRNDVYQEERVPFKKIERQKQYILLNEPVAEPAVDLEITNQVLRDIIKAEKKHEKELTKDNKPELMVLVAKAGENNSKPEDFIYKSVPMSELSRLNEGEAYFAPGMEVRVKRTKTKQVEAGWKVVGSWFEETEVNRLLAGYVSNRLRLAAKMAESHHRAKLAREEAYKRYHQEKQSTAFADLTADLEGAEPPPLPQEPPPLPAAPFRSQFAEKAVNKKWWQWWK